MIYFYDNTNNVNIYINESSIFDLISNKQSDLENETGGMLFSRLETDDAKIEKVSTANKKDKSGLFSFFPNKINAQFKINKLFKEGFHYIGDWHTHPEKNPSPSFKDIQSIKDIYNSSNHKLSFMIHIIIGQSDDPLDFYVCTTDGKNIYQCTPMNKNL